MQLTARNDSNLMVWKNSDVSLNDESQIIFLSCNLSMRRDTKSDTILRQISRCFLRAYPGLKKKCLKIMAR
jgi:hypothetical protein